MEKKGRVRWDNLFAIGVLLGTLLINIKNVFTSCHIDSAYQVAMAYRMVQGDAMFSGMWDAHQTSAFFLAFFEGIFLRVTGSTTGIMVYANAVGIFCKTAVAAAVYGTFRECVGKKIAYAAMILALNMYPKETVLPDFANMQIWFALLLMCCLVLYFQGGQKIRWLVLGAGCLCIEALAYPSCVLVWFFCMLLFFLYSVNRKRDMCLFTGICVVCGCVYLAYFTRGNPRQFLQCLYYIWAGDESHAVGIVGRLELLGKDILALAGDMKYIVFIAVGAVIAAALRRAVCGRKGGMPLKTFLWESFIWFVGFYILAYLFHLPAEEAGNKQHFFILYLLVEAGAFARVGYLGYAEKRIFVIGQMIGLGGFIATLFLSDSGLFCTLAYLIPNLCVAIIPLGKMNSVGADGEKRFSAFAPVFLLCFVMLFRNFIYLNGWISAPADFYGDSIFGISWTGQYGPLKGIKNGTDIYAADVSYLEWQEYVRPGDKVLILSYPTLMSTAYLYQDVAICADSTISTPTYSERLFAYWEENPDKYPNVVVAKCYDGNLMIGEYNQVVEWLVERFGADEAVDGAYWRYYLKNDRE